MKKLIPAIIFSSIRMMIMAFTGCMNEKKALRYYDAHPQRLAGICGQRFAPAAFEMDSTIYKKGHTKVLAADTVSINIDQPLDSLLKTYHASNSQQLQDSFAAHPVYIHVPCPPASRRVDTVLRYRYVQVDNTAKESYLQYQRDSVAAELATCKALALSWQDTAKARSRTILKLSVALGLLVAGGIVAAYLKARLKFPV